jgi:hypothetical protein
MVRLSIIKEICFLVELLRPCRVNLGLNENSKLNDSKKYHKRVQTSDTSCGQSVSPSQQTAKNTLEGTKRQLKCILCNCAFIQHKSIVQHMHKRHAGLFIICKHNGVCTQIFRTDAEKSEHILQLTNKKVKLIKCDFCCLMYFERDHSNHFKRHHKNDNLLQCSYRTCPSRFLSEIEKQNHEALVHALTKKHKCIFCSFFSLNLGFCIIIG